MALGRSATSTVRNQHHLRVSRLFPTNLLSLEFLTRVSIPVDPRIDVQDRPSRIHHQRSTVGICSNHAEPFQVQVVVLAPLPQGELLLESTAQRHA